MDLNIYNIYFVVGLFGDPKAVHYYPNRNANGIDTSGILILEYPNFVCQCTAAKDCSAHNSAQIIGTEAASSSSRAAAPARNSLPFGKEKSPISLMIAT